MPKPTNAQLLKTLKLAKRTIFRLSKYYKPEPHGGSPREWLDEACAEISYICTASEQATSCTTAAEEAKYALIAGKHKQLRRALIRIENWHNHIAPSGAYTQQALTYMEKTATEALAKDQQLGD